MTFYKTFRANRLILPPTIFARLMRSFLLIFFLNFTFLFSHAADYVFDYNQRCDAAFNAYLSLHLDEGTNFIKQEIRTNPYNLMATFISDYEDCMLLFLNGNKGEYNQRKGHLDERMNLIEKGNKNDPWYRYCKAGLYLHWALVYVRMGENMKAVIAFRKSYLLAKENQQKFPSFKQNNIILGLEETAAGTIPDDYKWVASIFGLKGSVKKGIARFTSFLQSTNDDEPLRAEAVLYNVYLRFYLLSQQEEMWRFINSADFPTKDNLMHAFVKTNLALNYRKAAVALQTMKGAQTDKAYDDFPILDYETGSALQQQLSPDAIAYYQRFINRAKGKFFIKEAWYKLALSEYLQGNVSKAKEALEKVKTEGSTTTDADKNALNFAKEGVFPTVPILQARLLFDGGYFDEALQKLQPLNPASLSAMSDKLEYYFRYGRIYDEQGNDAKAVQFYNQTIRLGSEREEYFAARAALQMGMLYEKQNKKSQALEAYNKCISMPRHDFKASIDQQAKAGINRLTM